MKLEVLGPGCKNCNQLYQNAKDAAAELPPDMAVEVEKIQDIKYFAKMGVFTTPALVIDGKVVSVGKVLSKEQISARMQEKG